MALLAVPLRSEGTLDFAPPGRMLRRTTAPTAGFVLISGSRLEFGDDHQRQRVDLDAMPAARQFVDSFLSLVAGDRDALARAYEMDFRADPRRPDGWELALVPRLPATRRVFAQIAMRGTGVVIERMTLRETNGDETVTTFRDVDPARRYTPAELARLFGPEGR